MSDYFGALLRSAGALPVDARAPAALPMPDGDPFEQAVERTVEPAAQRSGADGDGDAAPVMHAHALPTQAAAASAAAQSRAPPLQSGPEPSRAPMPPGRAIDAAPHPAVQAALRWVAADPVMQAGARAAADSGPRPAAPSLASAAHSLDGQHHERHPAASPPTMRASERRAGAPATAAQLLPRAAAMPRRGDHEALAALAWHDAPPTRPPSAAPARDALPLRDDRVEVSIGSIHVSIDAPQAAQVPHAMLQSAALPPRPGTAPSAPRSDFPRSRLPRG